MLSVLSGSFVTVYKANIHLVVCFSKKCVFYLSDLLCYERRLSDYFQQLRMKMSGCFLLF